MIASFVCGKHGSGWGICPVSDRARGHKLEGSFIDPQSTHISGPFWVLFWPLLWRRGSKPLWLCLPIPGCWSSPFLSLSLCLLNLHNLIRKQCPRLCSCFSQHFHLKCISAWHPGNQSLVSPSAFSLCSFHCLALPHPVLSPRRRSNAIFLSPCVFSYTPPHPTHSLFSPLSLMGKWLSVFSNTHSQDSLF